MSEVYFQVGWEGPRASEVSIALPHALAILVEVLIILLLETHYI